MRAAVVSSADKLSFTLKQFEQLIDLCRTRSYQDSDNEEDTIDPFQQHTDTRYYRAQTKSNTHKIKKERCDTHLLTTIECILPMLLPLESKKLRALLKKYFSFVERRIIENKLGTVTWFDESNVTGHYKLNLSIPYSHWVVSFKKNVFTSEKKNTNTNEKCKYK